MTAVIGIVPQSDADARLWRLTREVARLFSSLPWVLIGGARLRRQSAVQSPSR